jgi:hypothetical protein
MLACHITYIRRAFYGKVRQLKRDSSLEAAAKVGCIPGNDVKTFEGEIRLQANQVSGN